MRWLKKHLPCKSDNLSSSPIIPVKVEEKTNSIKLSSDLYTPFTYHTKIIIIIIIATYRKMAQWIEALAAEPGGLSLIPGTYMVEGETQLHQVVLSTAWGET